jgi:hypothetical protein
MLTTSCGLNGDDEGAGQPLSQGGCQLELLQVPIVRDLINARKRVDVSGDRE